MEFQQDQIDELKLVAPNLSIAEEGGYTYFLLQNFKLPEGCVPSHMDLLLCPTLKNGYSSILYFSQKPTGIPTRNWNGHVHVLGKSWYSYSWKSQPGHTLLQMVLLHLKALK